jgi:hypothetical protein
MANGGDIRDQALMQIFSISIELRRSAITSALLRTHAATVISGPFTGMKLLPEASWGDGDLPPKVLGCYEAELHQVITRAVARAPNVVVNVGCGEGYYAVGLARLLPDARVFAFETNPKGKDICQRAAAMNQVDNRLVVAGKCDIELLRSAVAKTERSFLIVDCEGAELELLDQKRLPGLLRCDMIIECHDFINPHITTILKQRFSESHDIEDVLEGPRDPNRFASLRSWASLDRWLAVNENRPVTMNWLVCWAR